MSLARARSGLTVVEVLVALVLLAVVAGLITRTLLATGRVSRALAGRSASKATLEQSADWLRSELQDLRLSAVAGDLVRFAAESLSYRARRSAGLACRIGPTEVLIPVAGLRGWRLPHPGRDSLLIYSGGGVRGGPRGRWIAAAVTSLDPDQCGAVAAWKLGTLFDTTQVRLQTLASRAPVLTFEIMQARLYRSQGDWWLGARSESAAEAIQPLAGPLASSGLRVIGYDSAGGPAATAALVRDLDIRLSSAAPSESLTFHLRPRNLGP